MKKVHEFTYERYNSPQEMPEEELHLVEQARRAIAGAYAPYSGFRVGAAAKLASGKIITASNQESVVFPAGLCAEQNLLTTWQSSYGPTDPIVSIAIASDPGVSECYPCGICRQVLSDCQARQQSPIKVVMASDTSATAVTDADDLMPFTFKF